MTRIVYSSHYNMGLLGMEQLHPFDVRKFEKAWKSLAADLGPRLQACHTEVDRPATDEELLTVHTVDHLERMKIPSEVARAVEVPVLKWLPYGLLDSALLTPVRWAVRGTVLATRLALSEGFCINLGGGFHHAMPDRAEGFCLFSDLALAIHMARWERWVSSEARIVVIDLDAHQGNGTCTFFQEDPRAFLFDMFNADVYPNDPRARSRIDCPIPLEIGCSGTAYLQRLENQLSAFLDSVTRSQPVELAVYVAGTDVVQDDPVGLLNLSPDDVLARDQTVVTELRGRNIPTVMVLGGGYTRTSFQLVANSVGDFLRNPPPDSGKV